MKTGDQTFKSEVELLAELQQFSADIQFEELVAMHENNFLPQIVLSSFHFIYSLLFGANTSNAIQSQGDGSKQLNDFARYLLRNCNSLLAYIKEVNYQ